MMELNLCSLGGLCTAVLEPRATQGQQTLFWIGTKRPPAFCQMDSTAGQRMGKSFPPQSFFKLFLQEDPTLKDKPVHVIFFFLFSWEST